MEDKFIGIPLNIDEVLNGLFYEVIDGIAYLSAARRVAEAAKSHPVIINVSPLFFGLTFRAHLIAAQLCASRLFDERDGCASIPWLLKQALSRPHNFDQCTAAERDGAIKKAEQTWIEKTSVLTALGYRRDRSLAHLDRKILKDPEQFTKDAHLTHLELEGLFAAATEILNSIAHLQGKDRLLTSGNNFDDLHHTLALVEKGVQANAQEVEQRFGPRT